MLMMRNNLDAGLLWGHRQRAAPIRGPDCRGHPTDAHDAHFLLPSGQTFSQLMLLMPAFGATANGLRLHEGQLDIQLMLMMRTFLFVLPSYALDAGLFWGPLTEMVGTSS